MLQSEMNVIIWIILLLDGLYCYWMDCTVGIHLKYQMQTLTQHVALAR